MYAHDLAGKDILSIEIVAQASTGTYVVDAQTDSEVQFSFSWTETLLGITNHPTNSANLINRPFKALIIYQE